MGNLSLQEAFATFGAKPANRFYSTSAIASDGAAMILACSSTRFTHPARGTLRYEDTLTRPTDHPAVMESLGQHLATARDGSLPVRMIVITERPAASTEATREIHVRADLIGKVTEFDGERFVIDFVRVVNESRAAPSENRRRGI
jgi:hypothetical protein